MPDILTKMDVEHQAVEDGMFLVREELLSRGIRDGMHARSTKQPAERSAEILVVIDDGDVEDGLTHLDQPDDVRQRLRELRGCRYSSPVSTISSGSEADYCP